MSPLPWDSHNNASWGGELILWPLIQQGEFIQLLNQPQFLFLLLNFSCATIDVNSFEFQYLADHLSGKECNRLVASLHFHTFELPNEIDAAERRLPDDVPCIDLLTHWNATPKEGKGETHVAICHRLNQIGREDLAKWLSRTVSHELSKDLIASLTAERNSDDITITECNITDEVSEDDVIIDEAAWWELDSLMEVLIAFCLIILLYGTLYWVYLCCSKDTGACYEKVSAAGV